MKLYGLYSKKLKCLMAISVSANGDDADFCNSTEVTLDKYFSASDLLWTTADKLLADTVANTKGATPWYNTDFNSPGWNYKYYGDLSVVDLHKYKTNS